MHAKAQLEDLGLADLKKMFRAMQTVLNKAVDCQADATRVPRNWMLSHRGRGQKCPRCGHVWKLIKISGRTTYFCPHCQPL